MVDESVLDWGIIYQTDRDREPISQRIRTSKRHDFNHQHECYANQLNSPTKIKFMTIDQITLRIFSTEFIQIAVDSVSDCYIHLTYEVACKNVDEAGKQNINRARIPSPTLSMTLRSR